MAVRAKKILVAACALVKAAADKRVFMAMDDDVMGCDMDDDDLDDSGMPP